MKEGDINFKIRSDLIGSCSANCFEIEIEALVNGEVTSYFYEYPTDEWLIIRAVADAYEQFCESRCYAEEDNNEEETEE